ncbi:MAG TPA: PKD domain-containing protein [Solirubrobacterales bacterium]|nr:PKD domain-containing protein [Solirubrobacterales bacterium]
MAYSPLKQLTIALLAAVAAVLLLPHGARADVSCPSEIPVVQENNCSGPGSDGWRLIEYSPNVAGFATKTSVNLGEAVTLKLGRVNTSAASSVKVDVYRMGYYGNTGGRLITAASSPSVAVNNLFSNCGTTNTTTGLKSCAGWASSYTIPGSALPASGVYTVKLTTSGGLENTITFVVRDDSRVPNADVLFAVPTATYEAYNNWGGASGGKSLYFDTGGGADTIAGTPRAVKVSFDRPLEDPRQGNRFIGPDFYMVQWLEKQGYDVAYTEDVAIHQNPAQLKKAKVDMISGHSEYWSLEQMNGYLAARDAGVNIASFSGNTAYWKVRYEDGGRTLVCYKTVEGSGSSGSGEDGANDWGPDGKLGTADDALGLDQKAGTADDHPENSTTTFRDNGAPPGDPNAPEGGRVGPDMPENQLLGNMYYGAELQAGAFPLQIPASSGGNYAGDRIWRNTGIPTGSTTTIGNNLLGWEWDAIPTQAQYLSRQPAGVKPLTNSTAPLGNNVDWIQDEGRIYAKTPPPGQCACGQAVKYTAKSGALVFASGTNDWANGLAPNPDSRIIQATYNILSDMTVQPWTPVDVTLDPPSGPQPPVASFSVSPNPAQTNQTVTFDGSTSTDLDGGIAKYEWDLNGDGTYEKDTGTNPVTTTSYASTGVYTVRLRVTDEQGVRSTTNRALSIDNSGSGSYPSRVLGTTGLVSFWRLGDAGGSSTLVDSFGTSNATVNGSPTLGVTGAIAGDSDTAASFDGLDDAATANLSLSGTSKVTVEFWMKWNGFANDDDLAMEYTANFNSFPGGFLIDPNAPQESGKFGVAIGNGSTRNNVFFARPSAGVWHHYAFVMDSAAAASEQIKPYVDGQAVAFTKTASGTGAGNFANSSLYFMSRAASALFGAGSLDELAIYNRALDASTIASHYAGNQQSPTASFNTSPNPADVGQTVNFNGSSSSSPNGAIAKYEWDLDGNGTYETNTGATPTASSGYATPGPVTVGLRVTDAAGKTATASETLSIDGAGAGSYSARVLATAGLINYWRAGEASGTTLADSKGTAPATLTGGPGLGVEGAVAGDADTAVSFNGTSSAAQAALNLSNTNKLTLEFWMKWDNFANDDDLAFELTPNFNSNPGGFLVDPNAPEEGGKFGVGIGSGETRNTAYFTRPSAGLWHHYALVMDTTAPASEQVIPYVDGQPVPYVKTKSGTGAGNFANSTLYFMSRAASALFGSGDLDEVALYNRALPASTIAQHFGGNSQAPLASFTASPNPAQAGQLISFDGSASTDLDGTIAKYEWDLNGDGTYETNTGTTPTASTTLTSPGTYEIKLRVTDNAGNTGQTTRSVTVEQSGAGAYSSRVLATAGLIDYWRMSDAGGTALTDVKGGAHATVVGGPEFGVPSALPGTDTAVSFNGTSSAAQAALNLSNTDKLTLEFWMKWDNFGNDDDLAFELTPNFNSNPGGFIVDPNAPEEEGKFGVGIGSGESRNTAYFARPSAGAWHHYALVMDAGAAAAEQVIPYVDGQPVPYVKTKSGTGAGNFANSTLYFMSRAAGALFGAGDLDEVALYNRALPAWTIEDHYFGNIGGGEPPVASFTATPNPAQTAEVVNFDASGSSDPDGTIAKYEWDLDGNGSYETETGTEAVATRSYAIAGSYDVRLRVTDSSGNKSSTLRTVTVTNRAPVSSFAATPSAVNKGQLVSFDGSGSSDSDGTVVKYEWDLDGNGTYETNTGTTATASRSYSSAGTVETRLRVTDDKGATAVSTKTVTVTLVPPAASFTASPNPVDTGSTVSFNGSGSSDSDGTVVKYEWDLDGNGTYETNTGATATTSRSYSASGTVEVKLRVTDDDGQTATTSRTVTVNNRPPVASFTVSPSPANTRQTVTVNGAASSDPDGAIAKYEWDLDGNGTYETSTGVNTSTTKSFTATGTVTLGLQVTDNKGATATTTRSLTVNSAYRAAVLGTSGVSDLWRLDETSGTTATDANGGNNNGSYVSSPTSVAALISGETNSFARSFDGTSQYIDFSPTPFGTPSNFSVEAWVRTSAAKAAGGYHFLVSDSSADFDNGFSLVIDSSNRPVFAVARQTTSITRGQAVSSTTVPPNTTHHLVGTYDGNRARIYVDGVERANVLFNSDPTWSSNRDLRIGRPISSTSLAQRYLQGSIDEPALYTTALSAATVLAHYNAGKP